jgi:hypothetical protein
MEQRAGDKEQRREKGNRGYETRNRHLRQDTKGVRQGDARRGQGKKHSSISNTKTSFKIW